MRKIAKNYELQTVVATLGGDGAISFRNGIFHRQDVFKVLVKDTVGAGDAFLAAYLTQYLDNATEQDALKFACAVGALTASKNGGTPDISPEEIQALLQQ